MLSLNSQYINPKTNTCIIIPILHNSITDFELSNIRHNLEVFKNRDVIFIHSAYNIILDKYFNKEHINEIKFDYNISEHTFNISISNNLDFYEILYNFGFEYCLMCSTTTFVNSDILDDFINLNYDIYGAPDEPLFLKNLNNKFTQEFNLCKIKSLMNFCKNLNKNELHNSINENIIKHNDLICIAPKYVQVCFGIKNWIESYLDLYNVCPNAKISIDRNSYKYNNEYNIKDNFIFDFVNHFKYENINYIYEKNTKLYNLNFYIKDNYNNRLFKFIHNATFPDFNKVQNYIKKAESQNKIPKIIHFCFLNWENIPEKNKICINTWLEQFSSDYIFINWTPIILNIENNEFLNKCIEHKKWAFFADYIRVFALYNYGGIYLDSDIFIRKDFDDLLDLDYVFDTEIDPRLKRLECGCMLSKPKNKLIKTILDFYEYEIKYPENDNFWSDNYKYDSYIMPDLVNSLIEDKKINVWFGIDSLEKYKICLENNKNDFYTLNSYYLSSPAMQRYGCLQFKRNFAYASHCFTNSYL